MSGAVPKRTASAARRRPRAVRSDRRPRQAQAVPGAVSHGGARRAGAAGRSASPAATGPTTSSAKRPRRRSRRPYPRSSKTVLRRLIKRLDLVQGDYADPTTWAALTDVLDKTPLEDGGVLHGDPAVDVPDGCRVAGVGRAQRAWADRRREAVRARSALGPRAQRRAAQGVPRAPHLPHRPLPRQGVGRGPARVPLLEHAARTGVEPALRAQRADHDVGDDRRRGPRFVLRLGRGDP